MEFNENGSLQILLQFCQSFVKRQRVPCRRLLRGREIRKRGTLFGRHVGGEAENSSELESKLNLDISTPCKFVKLKYSAQPASSSPLEIR